MLVCFCELFLFLNKLKPRFFISLVMYSREFIYFVPDVCKTQAKLSIRNIKRKLLTIRRFVIWKHPCQFFSINANVEYTVDSAFMFNLRLAKYVLPSLPSNEILKKYFVFMFYDITAHGLSKTCMYEYFHRDALKKRSCMINAV